jgi:XrtJ-associated TM-motif-TM protein
MRKLIRFAVRCALLLLVAVPLYGQGGCEDSPENPTLVLALVAGVGAVFSAVRTRVKARRQVRAHSAQSER